MNGANIGLVPVFVPVAGWGLAGFTETPPIISTHPGYRNWVTCVEVLNANHYSMGTTNVLQPVKHRT